jgi:hypothetical protein
MAVKSGRWVYGLLGGIATIIALVSIIQSALEVGLTPLAMGIVESYRAVVHPPMGLAASWLKLIWPGDIPDALKDCYALSFLGVSLLFRTVVAQQHAEGEVVPAGTRALEILAALFAALTLLGIMLVAGGLLSVAQLFFKKRMGGQLTELDRDSWDYGVGLLGGLAGATLFFALDASL